MPTVVTDARRFTADRAWGTRDLAGEHVAHPRGEARVLAIERNGSV